MDAARRRPGPTRRRRPRVKYLPKSITSATRWISVPVPSPPPQHIVTRPRSPSRRSSSATRVAISLAPVAPTAWPSAIAPPLTFTRSTSGCSSRCHASTTEENASLTSNRSMSSMLRLLRCNNFRVAGIGPVSMMIGSTPTVVWSTTRARGRNPSRRAASPEHSSTAAAPSLIGDDDPAVIRPSSLRNTGLRLASVSTVVSGRTHWSAWRIWPSRVIGTISACEPAVGDGLGGVLVRMRGEGVHLLAAQLPAVGDQLGAFALVHKAVAVAQLGRPGIAVQFGRSCRGSRWGRGPCAPRRRRSRRRECPRPPVPHPFPPRSVPSRSAGPAWWPVPRADSPPVARHCGRYCVTVHRTGRCSRSPDPRPAAGSIPLRAISSV